MDAALSLGIETLQNMPVSRADVVTVVEGYFGTRSTECREATLGNAIHAILGYITFPLGGEITLRSVHSSTPQPPPEPSVCLHTPSRPASVTVVL